MIAIIIGILPALVLRLLIIRRPVSISLAIVISIIIFITMGGIFHLLEWDSTTLAGVVAAFSFVILSSKIRKSEKS
jgi:uncharacterized membrane protein YjdF